MATTTGNYSVEDWLNWGGAPHNYAFLVDANGSFLVDANGYFLIGAV